MACKEVSVPDAAQTPGAQQVLTSKPLREHSNTGSRPPENKETFIITRH